MNVPPRSLTDEERSLIRYFHEERGDITRWVDWEDPVIQSILHYHHPELVKAVRDVHVAEKMLAAVVRNL